MAGPDGGEWQCGDHGSVPVLWRPEEAAYDDFVHHLRGAAHFPTLLPWPMGPGWRVSDFGWVGDPSGPLATLTACSGTSELDGPVDVIVVAEEPATGLGSRVALRADTDPGSAGEGAAVARVRLDSVSVPLWGVSTSSAGPDWDRTVLVGEALGRWLWIVLRPASAVLLMRDEWILRDLSTAGPALVEMPFGGPPPVW